MAAPNTGMAKADMKRLLAKSKQEPVNCAIGLGEDAGFGLLMLHRTKAGRAMGAMLKDEFPVVRNLRWGTAFVDVDDDPKLVKLTLNAAVSGMARRLVKTLKGTGFNKVVLVSEDGSAIESHEEADEELDAAAAVGAPAPPPAAPPPPAAVMTAEEKAAAAATLSKALAQLIAAIPAASGADAERKAVLAKLATDANANIKTGNLTYAANFIAQLRTEIAVAPKPAGAAGLGSARLEWTGTQTKVRTDLGKLRAALGEAYADHPMQGQIQASFDAKVGPVLAQFDDRVLDSLDEVMAAPEPGRETLLAQTRALLKQALEFALKDPIVAELDANPFAPLAIRAEVGKKIATMAKALH